MWEMKKNEIIQVKIEKLAYKGKGVAKLGDFVIFVPFTVPGDVVRVRIRKKKKKYAEASVEEWIERSQWRIQPPCQYFGYCGGCKWMSIPYEKQLEVKRQIVEESLSHLAKVDIDVLPTLPSPKIFHYRNKMEFSFSSQRWLLPEELKDRSITKTNALGFHAPGTFDRVMDIQYCYLQSETLNKILNEVRNFALNNEISYYNMKNHIGLLRFLVLRETTTNEIMVNIITSAPAKEILRPLADILVTKFPNVVSVINGIHEGVSQVAFTEKFEVLAGRDWITEELDSFTFRISPNSFFQTNSYQAVHLYRLVKDWAGLTGREQVWDLYGGTGTIGLFIANKAKWVKSIELIEAASEDGKTNARLNEIENIEFVQGDMKKIIESLEEKPDVVITDPPRDGMHPKVVQALIQRFPERIVYVSCNPTTLSRDLEQLKEHYHIKKVQPVDMFPQTYHVETVVLLEKK
jgi:23S rRNA (uracil1939-C5)-methyltransferase